jgi:hypothetical protein
MSNDEQNFVFEGFDNAPPEGITAWDGQGGAPTIEPGEHLFEVTECKLVPTKAGDGRNFEVTYAKVDEGAGKGETFRQWYLCAGPNFKMRGHGGRIANVFRDALRVPGINPSTLSFETKHAVGCQMWAVATLKTSTKYDPETQADKTYTNVDLSQERPTEDAPQAAAAPPPARAASAPPSRPPAPPARAATPPARAATPPARAR